MTAEERSALVKSLAAEIGFDACGIAPAGPHPHGDYLRRWLAEGRAGTMGYLHRHVESRIDVRAWLPTTTNVIVVALNYHQCLPGESDQDDRGHESDGRSGDQFTRGRVAMYAWGEDYHVVVREKLDALVALLRGRLGAAFQARVCVDTSAIVERELAMAAGIGWIGKNTLVLNQTIGSFFLLGEILTDLPLAPDRPAADHCGSCTRCLDACPTQAFPAPYQMDAARCISYLTIEHRGAIDPNLAARMGDWVFGCDDCQTVCPFNRRAPETAEPRLRAANLDAARPALESIAAWDASVHAAATHGRATDRAKLGLWQRNAAIAARNKGVAD